jgi:uncharacterized protein
MKILALSDVHGDQHAMKEAAERASQENVDLVIFAGDLADEETGSVEGLIGPFKEKGLDIGIMPGNHDNMATMQFLIDHYNVKNLHGYVLRKGDVGIFGCGYANIGPHTLDEDDVLKTLKKGHDQIKDAKKKVMVTHCHPEGSIFGLGAFPGSEAVKFALEQFQPDVHLCGHIHETAGIEEKIGKTRVVNVGKHGKIIEI